MDFGSDTSIIPCLGKFFVGTSVKYLLGQLVVPQYDLSSHLLTSVYCFKGISSSKILGSHGAVEEDYSFVGCETVLLGECCSQCFEVLYCLHLQCHLPITIPFFGLATHSWWPLSALTLPAKHTVFLHKSS